MRVIYVNSNAFPVTDEVIWIVGRYGLWVLLVWNVSARAGADSSVRVTTVTGVAPMTIRAIVLVCLASAAQPALQPA